MRVSVDSFRRLRNSNPFEHFDRSGASLSLRETLVLDENFSDLSAHGVDWVQAGHRFLEDHPDLPAAYPSHFLFRELGQLAPSELNGSARDLSDPTGEELHDREGRHRLP